MLFGYAPRRVDRANQTNRVTEVGDATDLGGCVARALQREHRRPVQAPRNLRAPVGEPVVVRLAERLRTVGVLDEREVHDHHGGDHQHLVDPHEVHLFGARDGVVCALVLEVDALLFREGCHALNPTQDLLVHLRPGDADRVVRTLEQTTAPAERPLRAIRHRGGVVTPIGVVHEFLLRLGHVLRPDLEWVVHVRVAVEDREGLRHSLCHGIANLYVSGNGNLEVEQFDCVAAHQSGDRLVVDGVLAQHVDRLGGRPGVVVRISRSPRRDVDERVGHARHRRLPRVERREHRVLVEDLLGLEAHGTGTPEAAAEPEVGLGLLEHQRHHRRSTVPERELQVGEILEQAVERRRGEEHTGVLDAGNRLGDRVADAEPFRHAFGVRARRRGLRIGDSDGGVHARDHAELLELTPERLEVVTFDERAAVEHRPQRRGTEAVGGNAIELALRERQALQREHRDRVEPPVPCSREVGDPIVVRARARRRRWCLRRVGGIRETVSDTRSPGRSRGHPCRPTGRSRHSLRD